MSLPAETQAAIVEAMLSGNRVDLPPSLGPGPEAARRFDIHLRHYRASLTSTLIQKFPATVWLLGEGVLTRAAQEFIRFSPPRTACIAEYGHDFPEFLGRLDAAESRPYVEALARLDWLLGKAAIAVHEAPLQWSEIAAIGPELLPEARVTLQSGLKLMRADHAVDELILLYLNGDEPDEYSLAATESLIEVRGSRGGFSVTRLDPARFAFRQALCGGSSIGEAASSAIDADHGFDAGQALRSLADAGLIVSTAFQTRIHQ
jgi:hypothetical protein